MLKFLLKPIYRFLLAVTILWLPNGLFPQHPINHPPVVMGFFKKNKQNHSITFTQADFNSGFEDADKDPLVKIRIESMPTGGKLSLDGLNYEKGSEILSKNLGKLTFIPDKNYTGETTFSWFGSDGKDYSISSSKVRITAFPVEIFIPGGFSPNGDGINDFFVVKGADNYIVELKIFDRWGTKMYENFQYKNEWDGIANVGRIAGNEMIVGTYFYILNLNNGERETVGYLTLNR